MTSGPSAGPRRVFVDTSEYYALADRNDANFEAALSILSHLAANHSRLFTTNFVIAEAHALLLIRLGRAIALRFLDELDRSSTRVVRVRATDEQRARAIIEQYEDKAFSLTDALSFAVIERMGLEAAFAFDQHFAQYGAVVLQPNSD